MTKTLSKEIAFNGRLRTAIDGASIGPNDFQLLKNMRYAETNPRGIGGMTKINTSALASTGIRNGFHFRKSQPVESHLLAWTSDGKVWVNNTAAPNQGAFDGTTLFTDTAGGSTGRFSPAPGGALAYANGKEACLWGGTEHRCAGFIDYPTTGQIYDYSDLITNTKTDAQNVATIHTAQSTSDANTMLLLHCDGTDTGTTFTDSSTPAKTVTANVSAITSATQAKFGTTSGYFPGTGYLTIPDDTFADLSSGTWTIDFWFRPSNTLTDQVIYYQQTDANNYIKISQSTSGLGSYAAIKLSIYAASAEVVSLTSSVTVLRSAWSHIAVVENGDNYYIFINGSMQGYVSDASRAANYTGVVYIGSDSTPANYLSGYLDEFRMSNAARWVSAFSPAAGAYGASYFSTSYIGSIMPLDGVKLYIGTANPMASGAATMIVYEWNGTGWASITVTDNTAVGGRSLEQTGTVTWTSTAATSKPTAVEKLYLYWYKMVITSASDFSGATLSQVAVSIPFQAIKDIWDGEERPCNSFVAYKTAKYYDYTTNVLDNSFTSTGSAVDASTYAALVSLTTTDYLYAGFIERMAGVTIYVIDQYGNSNSVVVSWDYWNGSAWTPLNAVDGTMDGTKSLAKNGWVTWPPADRTSEFKRSDIGSGKNTGTSFQDNGGPSRTWMDPTPAMTLSSSALRSTGALYYYRASFSAAISADVRIYHVAGIPAPKDIRGYSFPMIHQNRRLLVSNADGAKNTILMGSSDTANVFNGLYAFEFPFGQESEINAAASLFLRFGSSVQDMLVLTKQGEVHLLEGNGSDSDTYRTRLLSEKVGCRAPLTMTTVPVGDLGVGIRRQLAIWESQRGIEVFDGASLMDPLLSFDIQDKFDPNSSTYAGSASNSGFYDPVYDEYHWVTVGSGEWVYSFKYKKWFQIVRGTGRYIYGGIPVMDTSGSSYVYGFDNAGFVHRLEYGTSFNGTAISHTLRTGDFALPDGSIMEYSQVNWFTLIAKAKTITSQNISMVYYNDTGTASYGSSTIIPRRSGYRLVNTVVHNKDIQTTFHGFEFSISTNNETIGFEPLYLGIRYTVFPRQLS